VSKFAPPDTFRCYDFDESNELTVDEMTLSLKSTLTGLAKLTGQDVPDDLELEDIAQLVRRGHVCCGRGDTAFRLQRFPCTMVPQAFTKADKNKDHKISFAEYQEYCMSNPEVQSWMAFFDDSHEDADVAKANTDSEMELEGKVRERSAAQEAKNDPDAALTFNVEEGVRVVPGNWLLVVGSFVSIPPAHVVDDVTRVVAMSSWR
jgi:hypothetical protein